MTQVKQTILRTTCLILSLLMVGSVHAQTCRTDAIKHSTPDVRYVDDHDGTVTDKQTGLMWERCPTGLSGEDCKTGKALQLNWQDTLLQVNTVNQELGLGGYADWRLPNRKELASLADYICYSPAININLFPTTKNIGYWTSSPVADTPTSSWVVDFRYGTATPYLRRSARPFRLVRGG